MPVLAAARVTGEVSPEHTSIVLGTLEALDRRLGDPEPMARAEADLTRYATMFDPAGLRRIAERLVEIYDPDGAEPDDEAAQRRRFFRMRQRTDSTWTGEFQLTAEVGAQLQTVLRSLSSNRSCTLETRDGQQDAAANPVGPAAGCADDRGGAERLDEPHDSSRAATDDADLTPPPAVPAEGPAPERIAVPDTRSHGQRTHDALADVCSLLLRSGELPAAGGVPATVIVTVREDQLERGTGLARLAGGGSLPIRALPHLADQCDVWTVLTGRDGAPLRLGRTRRLASPAQTVALIARDGGCSFPGCSQPPQWCERHHVVEWARGGATDLDNLTLLCRYHHRHHLERGWRVSINADGLPEWIPPVWIDPQQRPRHNDRILLEHRVMPPLPLAAVGGPARAPRSWTGPPSLQHPWQRAAGGARALSRRLEPVDGSARAGAAAPTTQEVGPEERRRVGTTTSSWLHCDWGTAEDLLGWLEHLAPGDVGRRGDLGPDEVVDADDGEDPFEDEDFVAFLDDFMRRTAA
ncbi:HNH endonuclease signature motif containing protein [Auraticoccus monumenti]|uniref:HNH endonuclease n=1 Tax=Auraticoccus monumenti TaxID=675864 RepID=A0A1G7AW29_9ACTN|nr:HNH endonuclease signature motif containing protein [Auraticoccus monumenti]SDE18205.1 HNH endonuclease [Auraticoccus monumenti]